MISGKQQPVMVPAEIELPPFFSARELVKMEFPDPRWAVPGLLPVGLAILAGKPKQGKSWLAMGLGIAIGHGGRALGVIRVQHGATLYLALEDRRQRLKNRLLKLQEDGNLPEQFILSTDWPRMGKGGLAKLDAYLTKFPETRLVIIDTLAKFRARADKMVRSQYDEDYATGEAIKTLADLHDCCILVIAHLRKMDAEDAFDTISGTLGLTGAADTILVIKRSRGQGDATLAVTGRDLDEQELGLKFDPILAQWAIIGSAEEARMSKQQTAIDRVLAESGEAMKARDIAKLTGQSEPACRKMLSEMVELGRARRVGEGLYMSIHCGVTAPQTANGNIGNNIAHNNGPLNNNNGIYEDSPIIWEKAESTETTLPTRYGNSGNVGNVRPVTAVTDVTRVTAVTDVTAHAQKRVTADCLDCHQPLPEGWIFRCPDCEERAVLAMLNSPGGGW